MSEKAIITWLKGAYKETEHALNKLEHHVPYSKASEFVHDRIDAVQIILSQVIKHVEEPSHD